MSGHSKWANIKHRKTAVDQKRAKEFSKALREISVAARDGADVKYNARLAMAVANAQAINVPKNNINHVIEKQRRGNIIGPQYIEIYFEGYDSSGLAYIIKMITSNKNRAVADSRYGFTRFGGKLGTKGSVVYLFNHVGVIYIKSDNVQEEKLMTTLDKIDAYDFIELEDQYKIITIANKLSDSYNYLTNCQYTIINSGLRYHPINPIKVEKEIAERSLKLIDYFRNHNDVVDIFTNLECKEKII